jgi:hypothetical protein
MKKIPHHPTGQAMITVLLISAISMSVITGAMYAVYNAIGLSNQSEMGLLAHSAAETGLENALIRFIRDPSYAGETIQLDDNRRVTISVGGTPKTTITATGTIGTVTQCVQAVVYYNNGVFTIESWNEIP